MLGYWKLPFVDIPGLLDDSTMEKGAETLAEKQASSPKKETKDVMLKEAETNPIMEEAPTIPVVETTGIQTVGIDSIQKTEVGSKVETVEVGDNQKIEIIIIDANTIPETPETRDADEEEKIPSESDVAVDGVADGETVIKEEGTGTTFDEMDVAKPDEEEEPESDSKIDVNEKEGKQISILDINSMLRNDKLECVMNNNFPELPHDVTFFVGPPAERISCHKLFLCIISPVFQSMFENKGKSQCEIELPEIEPAALRFIIRYAYTGKIIFRLCSEERLVAILFAAHRFSIPEIWKQAAVLLGQRLSKGPVKIFRIADSLQLETLKKQAKVHILASFYEILETEAFLEFSEAELLEFMVSDDLTVKSEKELFLALIRWGEFKCATQNIENTPENLRKMLNALIGQVHFASMSVLEVINVVEKAKILHPDEVIMLFKYIALPENERENLVLTDAFSQQAHKLGKRQIVRLAEAIHKSKFVSCEYYFKNGVFYSDEFQIISDVDEYRLKALGFMIRHQPNYEITLHVKIICGAQRTEQTVAAETMMMVKSQEGEPTFVTFDRPVAIVKDQKYVVLCSAKMGQLLMSREKYPLSFMCSETTDTLKVQFSRNCGILAFLQFVRINE